MKRAKVYGIQDAVVTVIEGATARPTQEELRGGIRKHHGSLCNEREGYIDRNVKINRIQTLQAPDHHR